MTFSPILISALIVEPLRYFFSEYGPRALSGKYVWHRDDKQRTLEIGHTSDFYEIPIQQRPRILVDRGPIQISKVGITDNMAEQKPFKETNGLKDRTNMLIYSGQAQILIEARHLGTCEMVADMCQHFINWARPEICDTQGFKEFGLPMSIGPCVQTGKEDTLKFQIQLSFPYIKEEHWRVQDDGVKLKNVITNITR